MDVVDFDKARAEYLLDCLANGRPVEPIAGEWTRKDIITLAGVCRFVAMSHGPMRLGLQHGFDSERVREVLASLPTEHREATEESWQDDLNGAIEFTSQLVKLVQDEEFDQHFEPNVKEIIYTHGEMTREIIPISGYKQD